MKSPRSPILITLPKELSSVEILLAADIHTGSAEFDEKKWESFEELLKQPNTYVIFRRRPNGVCDQAEQV